MADVADMWGMTAEDLTTKLSDAIFLRRVQTLREEIKDKGLTFRFKARAQAEALLKTSWELIHRPDTSAAVKADLIKSTVKWGGLEPKGDVVSEGASGGVTITINLDNTKMPTTPPTIDVTPDEPQ